MLYPLNALAAVVPDYTINSSGMVIEKSTASPKNHCKTEPSCSIKDIVRSFCQRHGKNFISLLQFIRYKTLY